MTLIEPYGGRLVDLVVEGAQLDEHKAYAGTLPSIQLDQRTVSDFELLVTGALSPLDRFMGQADYRSVLAHMRLAGGHVFPLPVTLPVDAGAGVATGSELALRNEKNELLGSMVVEELYAADSAAQRQAGGALYASGPLRALGAPRHHDWADLRLTPARTRAALGELGRASVVAFAPRGLFSRADEALAQQAIELLDGVLLLVAAGREAPGEIDSYTRVRMVRAAAQAGFGPARLVLALLPLLPRPATPRDRLMQALIERNYGANYMLVEHEPTGTPADRELLGSLANELGVTPLSLGEWVYLPQDGRYAERSTLAVGTPVAGLADAQVRQAYLDRGLPLPAWYLRPEAAAILSEAYPPRHRQGVCIWLTGLSGSGKSTTAEVLQTLLRERGRRVTELDGDVVRTHLSKGLGFSKQDRDVNIRRIGYVASEIVRHGGVVICAAVSPYRATRQDVRTMVGSDSFVEVFVDTPLEVCEQRDIKGMYAKARRGEIRDFTGVDDPYEAPEHPEIVLETTGSSPEQNARLIVAYLVERGFVLDTVAA